MYIHVYAATADPIRHDYIVVRSQSRRVFMAIVIKIIPTGTTDRRIITLGKVPMNENSRVLWTVVGRRVSNTRHHLNGSSRS